jgi:hypothetical protein
MSLCLSVCLPACLSLTHTHTRIHAHTRTHAHNAQTSKQEADPFADMHTPLWSDLYTDEGCSQLVESESLAECRIEKLQVRESHLQTGCDFNFAIRLVVVPNPLQSRTLFLDVGFRVWGLRSGL